MVRYINDGQHQYTPHTLRKLEIIKRERSRRQRGPPPRMLHQEQYHTGSEERGGDTSGAYVVAMHLRAPARHSRPLSSKKATTSLPRLKVPHRRKMRWMLREDGHIERVSASPTRRRRLSLSRTSPLHTSNTGRVSFTLRQEGHTAATTHHPQAPPDHKAYKATPSRRERRQEHRRPTKLGLSPGRPRGRESEGITPY